MAELQTIITAAMQAYQSPWWTGGIAFLTFVMALLISELQEESMSREGMGLATVGLLIYLTYLLISRSHPDVFSFIMPLVVGVTVGMLFYNGR